MIASPQWLTVCVLVAFHRWLIDGERGLIDLIACVLPCWSIHFEGARSGTIVLAHYHPDGSAGVRRILDLRAR